MTCVLPRPEQRVATSCENAWHLACKKTRVMLASIAFRLEDWKRPFKLDQKLGISYMRVRAVDVFLVI